MWRESKRAYLALNIICPRCEEFPRAKLDSNCELRGTGKPKNKDPIIILCEIEAIAIIILQIFCSL